MRCPPSQLSSMKGTTAVWSVRVRSKCFILAQGEMIKNGTRGPYPHDRRGGRATSLGGRLPAPPVEIGGARPSEL